MSRKRFPFSEKYSIVSAGAPADTIEVAPPERDEEIVYTQILAWDTLNSITSITMKSGRDGHEDEFNYVPLPAALERVEHTDPPIFCKRLEGVLVIFTGATSGDVLNVIVRGYRVKNVSA